MRIRWQTRTIALVLSSAGKGVALMWDTEELPWVQVSTSDPAQPDLNRVAVTIEEMVCPPAAFNSGNNFIGIEPGDDHATTWTLTGADAEKEGSL
jgi:aldose 1-epimerase